MRHAAVLLVAATACGRLGFGEVAGDAGVDGTARVCDPMAPFGPLVPVPGLSNPSYGEATVRMTSDELTGYLWTTRSGNVDLDVARRTAPGQPFILTAMSELNTVDFEIEPAISADELTLVFRSTRASGTGGSDLYLARRTSPALPFTLIGEVPGLNTTLDEIQPFLTATALYFASNRAGDSDVYRAAFDGTGFATPTRVEISTVGVSEADPAVSVDELTLYFTSDAAGGLGMGDLWMASRATTADPFGSPMPLTPLSTPALEGVSWVSVDHCRLYVSNSSAGGADVYVTTRP